MRATRRCSTPVCCIRCWSLVVVDALMSLATAGLFAAKWTARIETEWMAALELKRPDLKGRLQGRRDQMREAIPDWPRDPAPDQQLNNA